MIKTILFDMGNVLVRFSHEKMVKQLRQISGVPEFKIKRLIFKQDLGLLSDTGRLSPHEVHSMFCQRLNANPPFSDFKLAWSKIFSEMHGAEKLIESLEGRYRLVLASTTNEMHYNHVIENFPFIGLLENTSSYILGVVKPKLISVILEQLKLKPEECAFIDDLAENVEYARSLGIRAIQFKSAGQVKAEILRF